MKKINKRDIGYHFKYDKLGNLEIIKDPERIYIKYEYPHFSTQMPVFKNDLKFFGELIDGTNLWYII
jgi:hypothetical protein